MELYLNIVELGPGIYGAEAAARHWFDKPAARLTTDEAARLARHPAVAAEPQAVRGRPPRGAPDRQRGASASSARCSIAWLNVGQSIGGAVGEATAAARNRCRAGSR